MGTVCFFCDLYYEKERGKVGPLRGRAERAFRNKKYFSGDPFCRLGRQRGVSLRGFWRLSFLFFLRDCEVE